MHKVNGQPLQNQISVVKSKRCIIAHIKQRQSDGKVIIESVSLTIKAHSGKRLEIPLEVWQVDILSKMLGLSVDTTSLASYKMASKETVDERMEIYYKAIKKMEHIEE